MAPPIRVFFFLGPEFVIIFKHRMRMFTDFKPFFPTKEFKQDLNNIKFTWRDEGSKMVF